MYVLTTVLGHQISLETKPATCHAPQVVGDREVSQQTEHLVPKPSAQIFMCDVPGTTPKLDASPSTAPAGLQKAPPTVANTLTLTTDLPTETTSPEVAVTEYGAPIKKEAEQVIIEKRLCPTKSRTLKIRFKREVSFVQISQSHCLWEL